VAALAKVERGREGKRKGGEARFSIFVGAGFDKRPKGQQQQQQQQQQCGEVVGCVGVASKEPI